MTNANNEGDNKQIIPHQMEFQQDTSLNTEDQSKCSILAQEIEHVVAVGQDLIRWHGNLSHHLISTAALRIKATSESKFTLASNLMAMEQNISQSAVAIDVQIQQTISREMVLRANYEKLYDSINSKNHHNFCTNLIDEDEDSISS